MTSQTNNPFDRPDILNLLFHPRPGMPADEEIQGSFDLFFAASDGERLAMRFFMVDKERPTLLYFHGNGEVASDYDGMAEHFTGCGYNLVIGEYRGYGLSYGVPGVAHLMADARSSFKFLTQWLKSNGYTGPCVVMGRSLGSAPALEIVSAFPQDVSALIIESGFARLNKLIRNIGLSPMAELPDESLGTNNLTKATTWRGPLLILHATEDVIIPIIEGRDLFEASMSEEKQFIEVENAGHNDIFFAGFKAYLEGLKQVAEKVSVDHG